VKALAGQGDPLSHLDATGAVATGVDADSFLLRASLLLSDLVSREFALTVWSKILTTLASLIAPLAMSRL
jgi:hypothetical protein